MKNVCVAAAMAVVGSSCSLFAQTQTADPAGYHFEFRIIADGDAGAPTGSYPQFTRSATATQIGFWIQARVVQTANENWGITRVSPPAAPETSMLSVTDPVGSTLQRGLVVAANAPQLFYGRPGTYRNGGPATNATGNDAGAAAFPGITNNQNGAIDSNGTRIFSFDSYVGSTRNPNSDEDGNMGGNPWRVNGASNAGSLAAGTPIPSDGVTYSPWASVYRFMVLPTNVNSQRTITLDAFAMINGALSVHPTDASATQYAMEVGPGRNMATNYSFTWGVVPTPGAAALLGVGALAAGRRRR
ncbi:MAG: hypothetical protein QM783_15620 [Phycisphaerales bacterium]